MVSLDAQLFNLCGSYQLSGHANYCQVLLESAPSLLPRKLLEFTRIAIHRS